MSTPTSGWCMGLYWASRLRFVHPRVRDPSGRARRYLLHVFARSLRNLFWVSGVRLLHLRRLPMPRLRPSRSPGQHPAAKPFSSAVTSTMFKRVPSVNFCSALHNVSWFTARTVGPPNGSKGHDLLGAIDNNSTCSSTDGTPELNHRGIPQLYFTTVANLQCLFFAGMVTFIGTYHVPCPPGPCPPCPHTLCDSDLWFFSSNILNDSPARRCRT